MTDELVARLAMRRDEIRAERVVDDQIQDLNVDPGLKARFEHAKPERLGKRRRLAEAHEARPIVRSPRPPIEPMPAEFRCHVTRKRVTPLAVLPAERRGDLQVIWWFCPACDRCKQTRADLGFNPEQPGPHPLILRIDTPVPVVRRRKMTPQRLRGELWS